MDELRQEDQIPPSGVNQLRRLCSLLTESLSTVSGVILHGSAASAGFEPGRSNLDVLAIVNAEPGDRERIEVGEWVLRISNNPHPLEFSIILHDALVNWRHPCPHVLHFNEENRQRYDTGLFVPRSPTDEDLSDYAVSNACRTLAYLREDLVLSESEGRQWCVDRGLDTANIVADVTDELRRIVSA